MEFKSLESFRLCSLFLLYFSFGNCQRDGDPWTDITSSDTYQKQPACIQSCLLNVASEIPPCVDYGCVCTGDSLGTNFVAGFNDVSDCARTSFGDATDANNAVNAFRDICLIQQGYISASSTSASTSAISTPAATPTPTVTTLSGSTVTISVTPSTSSTPSSTSTSTSSSAQPSQTISYLLLINATSYSSLSSCSKFCLNSCRDAYGTVDEPSCGTDRKPPGWDTYYGLAYQVQCSTPSCLCAGGAFNLTYSTLWQQSLTYCNYLPTLQDLPDPEYDRMQGVLADYCALTGFPPNSYVQTVAGNPNNSALTPPGIALSTSDKIAIGAGVPSLFATIAAAIFTGIQARVAWMRYRDERAAAAAAALAAGTQPPAPQASSSLCICM